MLQRCSTLQQQQAAASRSRSSPAGCRMAIGRSSRRAEQPVSQLHRLRVRVSAAAGQQEDLVDELTGEVISRTSAMSRTAGYSLDAGGLRWAYRKAEPKQQDASKRQVLLLHGLGSSSWSYRRTLAMLGEAGYEAWAPDWPGHGQSSKPASGSGAFDYSRQAFVDGLAAFVRAAGIRPGYAVVVQGFVLGQYGLLHALAQEEQIDRLFILNTPLAQSTKLRPELAAYKSPLPFMRPGNKPFDAATYNMAGSPYAMLESDVQGYAEPYLNDPAASAAVGAVMQQLDWAGLLRDVDDGFRSWRKPTVLLFGTSDPFVDIKSVFQWCDDKRTTLRLLSAAAKLGHCPQEDYPEALQETLEAFLRADTDAWPAGKVVASKMTRRGVVEA